MHYGSYFFSKNNQPTMVTLNKKTFERNYELIKMYSGLNGKCRVSNLPATFPDPNCKDCTAQCPQWAKDGACAGGYTVTTSRGEQKKLEDCCAKSCKKCGTGSGSGSGSSGTWGEWGP